MHSLTTTLLLLVASFPGHGLSYALENTAEPASHVSFSAHLQPQQIHIGSKQASQKTEENNAVPLEIYIMSKCPDAKDCMELLIAPTLEKVKDIVDFKMSFIGHANPTDGGVACKHGPDECIGNMLHLCAQHIYPLNLNTNGTSFLPFSECLLHSFDLIPKEELIRSCADKAGIDFQKLNTCISDLGDNGGIRMLRDSMEHSQDDGVRSSCTVRLAGKTRCVRDDGGWRDCKGGSKVKDLVRDIRKEYEKNNDA